MDIKLKNKYLYITAFIISIYMLAFSLMSTFDIIENREYLGKDAYFKSYIFKGNLEDYLRNVKILLQYSKDHPKNLQGKNSYKLENIYDKDENAHDKEEKNIEEYEIAKDYLNLKKSVKYYIRDKKSGVMYTNLEDESKIEEYIENQALYSINIPNSSEEKGYLSYYSNWFWNNDFQGKIIILEDPELYSQFQRDYKYYNSVGERLIKETMIGVLLLLVGLFTLIYIMKKKNEEIFFVEKMRILNEKIPVDLRASILIVYSFIIMIYMFEIQFFYSGIDFSQFFKLTFTALYTFYLILSIKSIVILIKNKDLRVEQFKDGIIYKYVQLIKEILKVKNIKAKKGKIIMLTILLGSFTFAILLSVAEGDEFLFALSVLCILIYFLVALYYVLKKLTLLNKIIEGTDEIVSGNLDYTIEVDAKGGLSKLTYNINNMKEGFKKSVESEIKSERLKSELITNVSHDLKTPLTSIINYINLLKKEDISEEESSAYIQVLDRKSQRLKTLIDDLFEASKMSSGSVELKVERVDIVAILRQAMGEFHEKIENSSLTFKVNIPNKKIYLNLDGKKTWRVFENLIGNILKYSLANTRVYMDLIEEDNKVIIVMKNISAYEMDFNVEEIYERFKRGDKSRKTEGSGLGLAIAKSIVELQGGKMNITIDGDLFKVSVEFNKEQE